MSNLSRADEALDSRILWIAAATILLVGILLRFFWLGRWSLWTDELYTWRIVQDLRLLREGVPDDQHPPLYHLLLAAWLTAGDGEAWLRLPSAVAGAAAIPVMLGAGTILGKRRLGLIAAALTATSPLLVWYAREMRMYGLATLFWTLAILFFLLILLRERWWAAVGLALANVLGLYTAYPTLGLIGLQVALALPLWLWRGEGRRRRLVYLVAALALTAAGFVPWLPYFAQQLSRAGYDFNWPIPWDPGRTVDTNLAQTLSIAAAAGAAGVLLLWLAFGVIWRSDRLRRRLAQRAFPLALIVAAGFLVLYLLGAYPRGLTLRRQILVFWPVVLLLGAWALGALGRQAPVLIVCALGVLACGSFVIGADYEDWRGTASYLYANAAPDDRVYFEPSWATMSLDYYDGGTLDLAPGRPQSAQPPPASGETIWFVVNRRMQSPADPTEAWLRERAILVDETRFAQEIVVLAFRVH
jgi:uncharacterized membrane protein